MFVVDDVNWLREKLDQINALPVTPRSISMEKALMEAAFPARRLLENINKLDFDQYKHTLETRTMPLA